MKQSHSTKLSPRKERFGQRVGRHERFWSRVARAIVACGVALGATSHGASVWADQLDEIRQRGTLVWAADEEGGAPYVFRDKQDASKLIGFEVELADMIAQELGVKAQFQQGEWANLPSLLIGQKADIVLNGYELTEKRQQDFRCSRPYYIYGLQLLADNSTPIKSWNDLRSKPGGGRYKVGVLEDSAAENYVKTVWSDFVDCESYKGTSEIFSQVKSHVLDATVQDDCIAVQFANDFPTLRFVERPVAPGYYVVLIRRTEERTQAAINDALSKIINDGRLQKLYDRWDMSGRSQVLSLRNSGEIPLLERPSWLDVLRYSLPVLFEGAGMTVVLSLISMPLAILIGILVAIGRMYGPSFVRGPLTLYVEVLRGTPLMLQLFFVFFLLPEVGIQLPAFYAAIIGLAVNYSAYEAEIYRAGLQAIPVGQMEAALSLGLTKSQAIRKIILPQAVRIVIPPVTNDFIALFKDTSVCSVVTVTELTKQYNILARNNPSTLIHLAAITAVLYMMMSYPLSLLARWNERRLAGAK